MANNSKVPHSVMRSIFNEATAKFDSKPIFTKSNRKLAQDAADELNAKAASKELATQEDSNPIGSAGLVTYYVQPASN